MSVAEICVDDVEELSCSVDPWQTQIYRLAGSYFSGDTPIAELGRTAGYYREIFGECPSQTLKSNPELSKLRFSDLLDSAVH